MKLAEFIFLLTVWHTPAEMESGAPKMTVYPVAAMSGEQCLEAVQLYMVDNPGLPVGEPSCQLNHPDWIGPDMRAFQIGPNPGDVIVAGPCPYEDSHNCFWDAKARGNGKGQSFVDVAGIVHYMDEVDFREGQKSPLTNARGQTWPRQFPESRKKESGNVRF